MKKVLLSVFALALVATTLTSCKKDYTCACKDSTGASTGSTVFPKTTKSDATDACNTLSSLSAIGGGSCSLN